MIVLDALGVKLKPFRAESSHREDGPHLAETNCLLLGVDGMT